MTEPAPGADTALAILAPANTALDTALRANATEYRGHGAGLDLELLVRVYDAVRVDEVLVHNPDLILVRRSASGATPQGMPLDHFRF
jgi:hypothetical protein